MEISFNYDANKTHFHNKGFALSLVLKVKLFGTRKWPIHFGGGYASLLGACLQGASEGYPCVRGIPVLGLPEQAG